MSKFKTTIKPTFPETKIGLNQPILTIGSCFADTMGSRFKKFKFETLTNPFGTLFNPVSIHSALHYSTGKQNPELDNLIQSQDIYYHYDFHADFSSLNPADLKDQINTSIAESHAHLKKTKWLIITYGTAWVYTLNDTKKIVANCHKMPATIFAKALLDEKTIVDSFSELHANLLEINPEINIILTVSPVRHIKDTLELNAVSKAILRVTCHSLCQEFENVQYFPAYEIMMDDLRDYRFYNADMIHPSYVAEEYIWDHFVKCFVDETSQLFIEEWNQLLKDLEHKRFHPERPAHQKFILKLLERIEKVSKKVNVKI